MDQLHTIIKDTIRFESDQRFDGKGATWHLEDGWTHQPVEIIAASNVQIYNLNIVAGRDEATGVRPLIKIDQTSSVTLSNVQLVCNEDRGGVNQIPLGVYNSRDVSLDQIEACGSPTSHNIEFYNCDNLSLTNSNSYAAFLDGIKVQYGNTNTTIENCTSTNNGRTYASGGPAGDGCDLTQGAGSTTNVVNCNFSNNTNGITFKYARSPGHPLRAGCYGVSIRGCNLSDNLQSGLFAQGYSEGSGDNTGNENNAPHPIGFTVSDTTAEGNATHGFIVGDGTWNINDCIAYRNQRHGLYLTASSRHCNVRNLLSVANVETNINAWGRNNDFDHAKCIGFDIFNTNASDWESAERITKLGINHQWKPMRQKHQGIYRRCYNEYAQDENGKPQHLPDHCWVEPYDRNGDELL